MGSNGSLSLTLKSHLLQMLHPTVSSATGVHLIVYRTTPSSKGDLPATWFSLFRLLQDVQRIWIARVSPRWVPSMVRLFPSLIKWHLSLSSSSSGSRNKSSFPRVSIWGSNTCTNFQNIDSSSLSVCHLGISFLQAKNESTRVNAKIFSWMRVCHLLVFQMLGKCKIPCLNWLCLSTYPISRWYFAMTAGLAIGMEKFVPWAFYLFFGAGRPGRVVPFVVTKHLKCISCQPMAQMPSWSRHFRTMWDPLFMVDRVQRMVSMGNPFVAVFMGPVKWTPISQRNSGFQRGEPRIRVHSAPGAIKSHQVFL
jgi:hypothetical protein